MMIDKSSMLYWYPKIKDLKIPQPRTEIIVLDDKEREEVNTESIPESVVNKVKKVLENFTLPVFIRADQASGKHNWKNACYYDGSDDLGRHLFEIVEFNLCADIMGLTVNALIVREFIPMDTLFTAFYGDMPVNPEIRFFIDDGGIKCWHWYWIEEAIEQSKQPSVANWKEIMEKKKQEVFNNDEEMKQLIRYVGNVDGVGSVVGKGFWSVDFCRAKDGRWILIDMAEGERSWHPKDCPNNRTPEVDLFKDAKPITEADFVVKEKE